MAYPWRVGRCLVWDVTVADTTTASYLHSTSISAGSAAETAASHKETKYTELSHRYEFVPHGPLDTKAACQNSVDILPSPRYMQETSHLFQRLMALQRFMAMRV
jgi:hypothetical protein